MKTLITLFCIGLVSFTMHSQVKARTVDNNANSGAMYTGASALQNAITASTPGDTLLIHPSATSYGVLTTGKRLIIVGLGHNPANSNINQKVMVSTVTFQTNAANSLLTGIDYSTITTSSATCTGIRILNNRGGNISGLAGANNWVIQGNIIEGAQWVYSNGSTGWLVKNNIFNNLTWTIYGFDNTSSFLNNIVITSTGNFAYNSINPIVNNNIFILTGTASAVVLGGSPVVSTVVFNNNLTYSPEFNPIPPLSGSNNLNETNPGFVNAPFATITNFYSNNYNVTGSAVNAGTDGDDLGVFGASNFAFDVHGRPDLWPYMTSLNISNSSVPKGQNINVTFTAQKKN